MHTDSRNFYDSYVLRQGGADDEDRILAMLQMIPDSTKSVLDVGCTEGRNLRVFRRKLPQARLCGTDVGESMAETLRQQGFEFYPTGADQESPFPDESFDVITCGEVIEHVFDPDKMLTDFHRILKRSGTLIITTPNLAYLPNRLLLAFGIQPLFTETSLLKNYGRLHPILGEGNPAQGHLRIFTLRALLELLRDHKFDILTVKGYRWLHRGIPGKIDKLISIRPSFAAGFIVAAERNR